MPKNTIKYCKICGKKSIKTIYDYGLQPICNRYIVKPFREEYIYPLVLCQCQSCATMQLSDTLPISEVVPRFDWVKYNEPEQHLDNFAESIYKVANLNFQSKVYGLTYKDSTILKRLETKCETVKVNFINDSSNLDTGVEHLLATISFDKIKDFVKKNGCADVVIARHILEHTQNPHQFLKCIKELVKPSGYIVFEVPDCERAINSKDYNMIWEEHVLYFTKQTLFRLFKIGSLEVESFVNYPYDLENVLAVITKKNNKHSDYLIQDDISKELNRGIEYGDSFIDICEKVKGYITTLRQNLGRLVFWGAGHIACTFINLMGISNEIDCVIDDHPSKKGFLMPLSHLPIRGSDILTDMDIKICILAINPEIEKKLISKFQSYLDRGGKFLSIYPSSNLWIMNNILK